MAKAITKLASQVTVGLARLGQWGGSTGSVRREVHDGDTVVVEAVGNISVRFLGIDTPEVSFTLPEGNVFRSTSSEPWQEFLSDPWASAPADYKSRLGRGLCDYLADKLSGECALNHSRHAENAHRKLEELVEQDMAIMGETVDSFRFFMAFAHEIMDGYGRFLCFLNRFQENKNEPEPRPNYYNERLLQLGMSEPYFIWPNINPFQKKESIVDAVPTAGDIGWVAEGATGLGKAREWIQQARQSKLGIFDEADPQRLSAFELRFLGRHKLPSRWLIDMSDSSTDMLLPPTQYYKVPNCEDRLFIPPEYVPLFIDQGWRVAKELRTGAKARAPESTQPA